MRQTMLLLMVVCCISWLTSPALGEQCGVRQAQERLQQAWFDPGRADGKPGLQTAKALRQYQAAHNLPATGKLDAATCNLLMRDAGSFPPSATLEATPPQQIRAAAPEPMPPPPPAPESMPPPLPASATGENALPEILEFRASAQVKLFSTAIVLEEREVFFQFRNDAQGRPFVSMENGSYKEAAQKLEARLDREVLSTLVDSDTCTFKATHLARGIKRGGKVTMESLFVSRLEKTKDDWSGKEISQLVSRESRPAERVNKTTVEEPSDETRATSKERVDQLVVEAPVHDLLSLLYTIRFCGNKNLDHFYLHAKDLLTTLQVGPPHEEILRLTISDPHTRAWLGYSGENAEVALRAERYISRVDDKEVFRFWVSKDAPRVPLKVEFQGSPLLLSRVYHPKTSALTSATSPW